MSALIPYAFEGRELRALSVGGEPWFVAGDAAIFLAHASAKDLTRSLDEDEKGRHSVPTPGGEQEVSIVSEAGLYRAIAQRRATAAIPAETRAFIARFQRWLFHDVLPQIRRTGAYVPAVARIDLDLRLVAECRRTFGAKAAQRLWRDLGLPAVAEAPAPIAAPRKRHDLAALAERVAGIIRVSHGAVTRTALYRRVDNLCRARDLDAALDMLVATERVSVSRPAGASVGRPRATYRWCGA